MRTPKAASRFPLWLHPSGQWCKKHRGRNYYFGTDRDAALKRYAAEWDDLLAGRGPRDRPEAVTVADLVNRFLTAKRTSSGPGSWPTGRGPSTTRPARRWSRRSGRGCR